MAFRVRAGAEPYDPFPRQLRDHGVGRRKEQELRIESIPGHPKGPEQRLRPGVPSGSSRTSRGGKARWLVVRESHEGIEPLCLRAGSAGLLAVFSFEEEAGMFLRLGGYGSSGWRARESRTGELVSVLCGPCAHTDGVALDPLPGMLEEGTLGLVSVGRRRFLGQLLAGDAETATP